MKTKKNFNFAVKDEIYSIPIHVIVGDYSYYKKIVETKFDCEMPPSETNHGGETMVLDGEFGFMIVVWFPRLDFCIDNYGTISHELLHAAFQASRVIGIKFDYENQEPIVYYYEYLFKQVLEKLFKIYRKK